jgi:hypothetical protein
MWHGPNDIYVAPDALQKFAWSAPMRDLAAKVEMSDVGLKKLLRAHSVITPPQGHWNRVHAGRPVTDCPPWPARRPGQTGRISLDGRFRGLVEEAQRFPVNGPFASSSVPEDLEELRSEELKDLGRVAASRDLQKPHAGLVQLLKREGQRREKAGADRWYWNGPVFDTPLGQRKLKLLNGLFHALQRRDHSGSASEHQGELSSRCEIGDTSLGLTLSITGKHRTEMISGYHRPARDLPASTALCLSVDRKFRNAVTAQWQDDGNGKLETKLAQIAADLIVAGEAAFRQSLIESVELEEQHRKWEEERRQQRLAELEKKRIEDLKLSGELLSKASEIRNLVVRVRDAAMSGNVEIKNDDMAAWEVWALDYADRIDPVLSGQIFLHISKPELD